MAFTVSCATGGSTKAGGDYPMAPDVPLVGMDGSNGMLSDYRGDNVVLVNFWGLRCQNCIEEIPFLERLHNKYGGKGLAILGINTDGVDSPTLEKLIPRMPVKFTYPVILDLDFVLADAFQMRAAPFTILVARDGTIRYSHEGYTPELEEIYVTKIEAMLAE
jgi:thiol-disulfide isomerase/thioredoxin